MVFDPKDIASDAAPPRHSVTLPFIKMQGAGNDFVVFDNRYGAFDAFYNGIIPPAALVHIADRRFGIGCDQLIIIEPSENADVFMRIYNADGSEVSACGNATRCIAWRVMHQTGKPKITVETRAGILHCSNAGEREVMVDMGAPRLEWEEIPLTEKRDTLHIGKLGDFGREFAELGDAVAVSMGNPHVIFFVSSAAGVHLDAIGPILEHHELFPERVNVSMAEVVSDNEINLRVWERGAGETLACGTAACATLVAAHRRKLTNREAKIQLPGGMLVIKWDEATNHVFMTGPVAETFKGVIEVVE